MTCSREFDRSTTSPESSPLATSSTGCNTWIAPTDRGSVVEELETKDEEEEGRTGREEGGVEEEEVGQDKEYITNLVKEEIQQLRRIRSVRVWRIIKVVAQCLDTIGTTIYSP